MALNWQLVDVPFAAGVETKRDDKQLAPASLTVLEDAVFTRPGKLVSRNGVETVGAGPFTAAATPLATASLFPFQDEILATDGRSLLSIDRENQWLDRGAMAAVIPTQRQIHRTGAKHDSQDSVRHPSAGLTCFAWLEQDVPGGRVRFSLIDNETGVVRVDAATVSGANPPGHILSRVKVAPVGDRFAIFWVDSVSGELGTANELWWSVIDAVALTSSAKSLFVQMARSSGGSPGVAYDVTSHDGSAYVGWRMLTSAHLGLRSVDEALIVSGTVDTGYVTDRCIGLFVDDGDEELVAAWSSGFKINWGAWSLALAPMTPETEVVDYDLGPHYPVVVTGRRVGSSRLVATTNANDTTFTYSLLPSSVEVAQLRGAVLASKPIDIDGSAAFLVSVPTDEPTLFLVDDHCRVLARMLPSLAAPRNAFNTLPEVNLLPGGAVEVAALIRTHLYQAGVARNHYTAYGLNALRLRFRPSPHPASVRAGSTRIIGGGVVRTYDGGIHGTDDAGRPLTAVELGFAHAPNKPAGASDGSGKLYSYVVVWAHTDSQGSVHRSKPSLPLAVARATDIAGGAPQALTVRPLHLSAKAREVVIEVYRTATGGSVYHLAATAPNDPDSDTVALTDSATDAEIESALMLYTTGDVLENAPPPACEIMVTHRNRVWCVDSMSPTTLRPSKTVIPGQPVEFSDDLAKDVEADGGPVTGLASIDDKLILFKSDRIYVATGQGPDDMGAQDDFSDFSRITADVGCVNHRTVVVTPNGVIFQSRRGIYLLDRSLVASYVGAPVEQHGSQDFAAALLVPDAHQVRFFPLTPGVRAPVYDYLVGQWSTFTRSDALDAAVCAGRVMTVDRDGYAARETPGAYVDGRTGEQFRIVQKFVTGWLNVGVLQGFARLRRLLLLGEYRGTHTITLSIAYDYDSAIAEVVAGQRSTSGPYQWEFRPARQKCEAIQLTIVATPFEPGDQAPDLSAMTFEIGTKRGAMKLSGGRAMT